MPQSPADSAQANTNGHLSEDKHLKLAIVRQRYNPFGGAERFVERALAALVSQGAQVTLFARDWEGGADTGFERFICRTPVHALFSGRTGRDRAFARCRQAAIAEEERCNFIREWAKKLVASDNIGCRSIANAIGEFAAYGYQLPSES